jgi:hypothetical protein
MSLSGSDKTLCRTCMQGARNRSRRCGERNYRFHFPIKYSNNDKITLITTDVASGK